MSRPTLPTAGAWLLLASGFGAATWSARVPVVSEDAAPEVRPNAPRAHAVTVYAADSLAAVAATRDLFRSDRRPASVAYDPDQAARSLTVSAIAPPKPTLSLDGIVWGSVPEAIVEGLPGVEGARVLRSGDVVAGIRLQRIEPSEVVLIGMDTVWTLTVRVPWR